MVVVVLTACPVGLRGDLTRWLLEIASGVFVGHVTARVRDRLWERITGQIRTGKAIMVYSVGLVGAMPASTDVRQGSGVRDPAESKQSALLR